MDGDFKLRSVEWSDEQLVERRERLELYSLQLREFIERLRSDDATVSAAAHRDYEFCAAGKPGGFASNLMGISHIATARACLRRADELNGWERNFLDSISHLRALSAKQRARLSAISAKVLR